MENKIIIRNKSLNIEDTFTDSQIKDATIFAIQSVNGDDLPYNTLKCTLDTRIHQYTNFIPSGSTGMLTSDMEKFVVLPKVLSISGNPQQYQNTDTTAFVYHGDKLLGKFYVSKINQLNKYQYTIDAMSDVGLLDTMTDYGTLNRNEVSVQSLIDTVMRDSGITYKVDKLLASMRIKGWLPAATKRKNLHQILFATNSGVSYDENGDMYISPLFRKNQADITRDRVFLNGQVKYPTKVDQIILYEHSFPTKYTMTQIFSGTIPEGSVAISPQDKGEYKNAILVLSDLPIADANFNISNGLFSIPEYGTNYIVLVRGTTPETTECVVEAPCVTPLKLPVKRKLTQNKSNINTVTIEDAYLVSNVNSSQVLDRLESYYSAPKIIETDVKIESELPGDSVSIRDPYQSEVVDKGIIRSMNMKLSHLLKATTEIIVNYIPPLPVGAFNDRVVLSTNQTWTVPTGVEELRVFVIGGGSGGENGSSGHPGYDSRLSSSEAFSKGGTGGEGGKSGKVLDKTIKVTPGQTFNAVIGTGGVGGAWHSRFPYRMLSGEQGSPTTFGEFSSDMGTEVSLGVPDLLDDNIIYAVAGAKTGDGGSGTDYIDRTTSERTTRKDANNRITYFDGGINGLKLSHRYGYAYGGGGGGAGCGSDGTNGTSATEREHYYGDPVKYVGGNGGNGGNALPGFDGTTFGSGGFGGGGGGGGGTAGFGESYDRTEFKALEGDGGQGGNGANGGNGKSGAVIIYYYNPNKEVKNG